MNDQRVTICKNNSLTLEAIVDGCTYIHHLYILSFLRRFVERKLTMNRGLDHHPLLRIYVNVLRYLGLWTISPKSPAIQLYLYLIYKCFVMLMICLFIAALAADLCQNSDNLLIITDDGCILAGLLVILFKLFNFQIYPEKLQTLLDFVDENIRTLHVDANPEYLEIWRQHILRERVTIYGFGSIGMCLIFALMFFTPTEFGALPIRSKYPFDVTRPPLHQVMFIYQGSVLVVAMLSILSMDNMVLSLCSQTFCHFEILRKNFGNSLVTGDTKNRDDEAKLLESMCYSDENKKMNNASEKSSEKKSTFVVNLSRCIKRHQEIIEFVQNLDHFYSPLMFVQLMASNMLICLTGFQAILVVGQNSGFMKFAVYLSAAFSQLFYWCWCGNELIYQSTSIAEVLWLCPWELEKMTSIKSLVTIPLMRAKYPLKLTAGKFYVMSLEAFISVLSGSYSFFTLLNKMNDAVN